MADSELMRKLAKQRELHKRFDEEEETNDNNNKTNIQTAPIQPALTIAIPNENNHALPDVIQVKCEEVIK